MSHHLEQLKLFSYQAFKRALLSERSDRSLLILWTEDPLSIALIEDFSALSLQCFGEKLSACNAVVSFVRISLSSIFNVVSDMHRRRQKEESSGSLFPLHETYTLPAGRIGLRRQPYFIHVKQQARAVLYENLRTSFVFPSGPALFTLQQGDCNFKFSLNSAKYP